MIVQINDDYFVVFVEDFLAAQKLLGHDHIKITEWVELNGIFISGTDYLILERPEVVEIMRELSHVYLTKENDVFVNVINQMMAFLKRGENNVG